jgi:hypothetical protein
LTFASSPLRSVLAHQIIARNLSLFAADLVFIARRESFLSMSKLLASEENGNLSFDESFPGESSGCGEDLRQKNFEFEIKHARD